MVDYCTFRHHLRWYAEVFDPPETLEELGPFLTERRARRAAVAVYRPRFRAQMRKELGI